MASVQKASANEPIISAIVIGPGLPLFSSLYVDHVFPLRLLCEESVGESLRPQRIQRALFQVDTL